ncbi:hypothetical protein ES705_29229 [subsurface metagenome]
MKKRDRKYRKDNLERMKERDRKYYKDNPEKTRQWRKNNSEHKKQWEIKKRKTDPKYNLNKKISLLIRLSLKGNKVGKKWEDLVGYTIKDLMKHLKKTMPKGYIWKDFFTGQTPY